MPETSDGQPVPATNESPAPISFPATSSAGGPSPSPSDPPHIDPPLSDPPLNLSPTPVLLPNSVVKWIGGMRKYAKGVVAFLVAVVAGAVAQGLIVGATAAWITAITGALTTVGVVAKTNTP